MLERKNRYALNSLWLLFILVFILELMPSCSKTKLDRMAYRKFVMEDDYVCQSDQSLTSAAYQLKWLPAFYSYIANDAGMTAKSCKQIENLNAGKKSDVLEFLLKIKIKDLHNSIINLNNLEKNTLITQYLSSYISRDISLITANNDTLQCISAQFERHFSIDDTSILLINFVTKKDLGENIKIIIKDQIFHQGEIKFNFSTNTYYHLPKLDISSLCS
jgi:hypothetical protein